MHKTIKTILILISFITAQSNIIVTSTPHTPRTIGKHELAASIIRYAQQRGALLETQNYIAQFLLGNNWQQITPHESKTSEWNSEQNSYHRMAAYNNLLLQAEHDQRTDVIHFIKHGQIIDSSQHP